MRELSKTTYQLCETTNSHSSDRFWGHFLVIELSSRLERTRISCYAALTSSRVKFANPSNLNRKSRVAQWKDLRFLFQFSHRLITSN